MSDSTSLVPAGVIVGHTVAADAPTAAGTTKTFSQTPEQVRALWIAALRSGRYAKAKKALCRVSRQPLEDPIGYCCLGVLMEVYSEHVEPIQTGTMLSVPSLAESFPVRSYDMEIDGGVLTQSTCYPNSRVMGWVGLYGAGGEFHVTPKVRAFLETKPAFANMSELDNTSMSLAILNDGSDCTLNDIADVIEFNPPGLFLV